jgi:type II secretory pathway pseudopilin PulG
VEGPGRDAGYVYAEVVLAVVIVGTALAALVGSMAAGFGHLRLASELAVAERLQGEAFQLTMSESLEATRARDGTAASPPVLASGAAEPAYAGYEQRFRASWAADPSDPRVVQAAPATDHLVVSVEVVGPGGPLGARTWVRTRR